MLQMLSNCGAVIRRVACCLLSALLLTGCFAQIAPPGRPTGHPPITTGTFTMPDGTLLPYREWLPQGQPQAVVLALHGMNDSRDAWEYPAPAFAAASIAIVSPDLRGFGDTSSRGRWPGVLNLITDAGSMARQLRLTYPHAKLILMGESMGAATLMVLAASTEAPAVDGYVLIAPAVWGRSKMSLFMRASLWLADNALPGLTLTGRGFVKVTATDNREALHRLSIDPLTIHATRVDAIKGLVDLMDQAMAAAPHLRAPSLFLYGGHDDLVPARATAATWRLLSANERVAFYPQGYHLLLRDQDRGQPIEDILSWIRDPTAPLPSGADQAAKMWRERQPADR